MGCKQTIKDILVKERHHNALEYRGNFHVPIRVGKREREVSVAAAHTAGVGEKKGGIDTRNNKPNMNESIEDLRCADRTKG